MAWHRATSLTEIPENGLQRVEVEGTELLIVKIGEKIFATQLRCTHKDDDLSAGTIENGNIVCSYHYATYNPATGEVLSPPEDGGEARALRTYGVKTEGDDVLVDV